MTHVRDLKARVADRSQRVSSGVAPAGEPWPDGAAIGASQDRSKWLALRLHVLEEAQLATRPQDPSKLVQRNGLIGNAAQHEASDGRVEALVGQRQRPGDTVEDLHVNGDVPRGPQRKRAHVWLGLDGNDLADLRRIEAEVAPVARAELDDSATEPGERLAALPYFLGALVLAQARIDAREQRVVNTARISGPPPEASGD